MSGIVILKLVQFYQQNTAFLTEGGVAKPHWIAKIGANWGGDSNVRGNRMTKFWPVTQDGNCASAESVEVLNGFNQAWDVPNLFVIDGAAMASSGCQNPSLTYMALTARACAYAVEATKRGEI